MDNVTVEKAGAAAKGFVADRYKGEKTEVVLTDDLPRAEPFGWVFFCETVAYQQSGKLEDSLIGQGPLAVDFEGQVHELPTHMPVSEYVELVQAGLLPRPEWWRERGERESGA
jgi:hypothetical protein